MVFLLEISKNSTAGSLIIKAFCIHTHKPPRPAPLKHKASITAHRTSRCLRPFGHLYGFVLDLRRPPRLFSHIILFSTKVVFKKAQNTSVHPQILRKRQKSNSPLVPTTNLTAAILARIMFCEKLILQSSFNWVIF